MLRDLSKIKIMLLLSLLLSSSILPQEAIEIEGTTQFNSSWVFFWSTPPDDMGFPENGIASEYDMRYSDSPITNENFHNAIRVPIHTPRGEVGSTDSVHVTFPIGTWYIVIKSADEVPNWSGISNVVITTSGIRRPAFSEWEQ